MIISATGYLYVKERLTIRSDRTGYNAPVMAFDSRRICLMEYSAESSAYLMMQTYSKKQHLQKKSYFREK